MKRLREITYENNTTEQSDRSVGRTLGKIAGQNTLGKNCDVRKLMLQAIITHYRYVHFENV
jgi:hypothetical protein